MVYYFDCCRNMVNQSSQIRSPMNIMIYDNDSQANRADNFGCDLDFCLGLSVINIRLEFG